MGIKTSLLFKRGKKGFIFALITIFIVALFVFLLAIRNSQVTLERENIMAERTEAIIVNDFTKTLNEYYLPVAVQTAATTALQAMTLYVAETQTPITDPYTFYKDLIMDGTIESGFTATSTGYDFSMDLSARDEATIIQLATRDERASLYYFGNTVMLSQEVAKPEAYSLEGLEEITLIITNAGDADSGDLYLLVYTEDVATRENVLIAIDYFRFSNDNGNPQEITFSLNGETPLEETDHYYLVLAAPFTADTNDYTVGVTNDITYFYSCVTSFTCDLQQWTEDSAGTVIPFPIDFAIDKAVMKESFLRSMTGYLEDFGQDAFGIATDIDIISVEVLEQTPWEVGATVNAIITTEERTVAFHDVSVSASGSVSIENIYDPYSLIYDYGTFPIIIQEVTDDFNKDDLYIHLSQHTYVFSENAPSYLGRFAGKDAKSSSCCGMQSILLANHIPSRYDDADKGFSYVDHKFDNSIECSTDATNQHYLYYITGSGTEWTAVLSGQEPLLDYKDVEFYHLDEMTDATDPTYNRAVCPNE